jgi:hypothetical protein
MSKKQNLEVVKDLYEAGLYTEEEIVDMCVDRMGVQENTVRGYVAELKESGQIKVDKVIKDDQGDEEKKVIAGVKPDEKSVLQKLLDNDVDAMVRGFNKDEIEYEVPEGEEKDVHVLQEVVTYDQELPPNKVSKPRIQKYNPKAWRNFARYAGSMGMIIHKVLHLPEGVPDYNEIKKL